MNILDYDYQPIYYKFGDGYSGYYIRIRHQGLTYEMAFYENDDINKKEVEVCLNVYRKRKDIESNFDLHKITGLNPFITYSFCKKAFDELYNFTTTGTTIKVMATNDKRAKAYEKFLSKYGFDKKYIHYKGLSSIMFSKIKN